ncbi:hypothetical protein [Streptomyces afghaniensis]|nr:hypothetical protein [Streptomyces afghaniensis]MDQ1014271.1 thymidylate kinase [Streptomyces afghaniensis]
MAHKRTVHVRRVHDTPAQADGARVLVDRLAESSHRYQAELQESGGNPP